MPSFRVFMVGGMLLMCLCMCFANRFHAHMPIWKVLIASVLLTLIGLLGAYLMAWIESGRWSGRSFFGAVFLAPILMFPVAMMLHVVYRDLMDLSAPAECIMLALLKVKCQIDGCCFGRIFQTAHGEFRFPSQMVECAAAILLMVILMILIRIGKWSGMIYPWYLILYGIIRFILNLFRETTPWIGPLAAGNFWSIIAVVTGLVWMLVRYRAHIVEEQA